MRRIIAATGALLLAVKIDHAHKRPVSTQLYVALRDLILSGEGGFGREVSYLAAITAVGLAVGVAGLRWRES